MENTGGSQQRINTAGGGQQRPDTNASKQSSGTIGSGDTLDHSEESVPIEMLWVALERQRRHSLFSKFVTWTIFVLIFTVITQMLRPVRGTFTVQDSLLQHTAHEHFPQANWPKTFYDISSDADWWEWVETVLLPNILTDKYFNGDPRETTWGSRFLNTVSMYNTQTAPVRFRQARVTDDSCNTPVGNSELSRPCWGDFSTSRQFKEVFGQSYGNRYLTDLNAIGGKDAFGSDYGTEAHVVDAPLNKARAADIVAEMKKGAWLNEQTRAVSIETNWYNANLDLSTYLMWHLDISPGGRFQPCVVIHSCRLAPYSTSMDYARAFLEVVFAMMVVYFCVAWSWGLHFAIDKKAYATSWWNALELVNLLSVVFILAWWAAYMAKDKTPFQALTVADYTNRPDLSGLVTHFNLGSNFAAFSLVFSYFKLFKCAQLFPSLGLLWRALELSLTDMAPFLFIFLLFTCGFTFAGHWIFGYTMIEFHNWGQSFTTLFQSLMGGLPYEVMSEDTPISAALFTFTWVLMMCMVFSSMFVAILTQWYLQVHEENCKEKRKLAQEVGPRASEGFFQILQQRWTISYASFYGRTDSEEARFDDAVRDVQKALRQADFTDSEWIRAAVHSGTKVQVADLSKHFRGDDMKALHFVQKVRDLAAMEFDRQQSRPVRKFADQPEVEGEETGRLQKLQATVGRLESDLKHLRGALHASHIAPTVAGQAGEGYKVEHAHRGVAVQLGAIQDSCKESLK